VCFCISEQGRSSLLFCFYHLKIRTKPKANKAMCCKSISHKNHDKNKCRRDGERWAVTGNQRAFFFQLNRFQLKKKNMYL
jgi:hypothetical protein